MIVEGRTETTTLKAILVTSYLLSTFGLGTADEHRLLDQRIVFVILSFLKLLFC